VVIADTATPIGYRKSLVTFSVRPREAMMKENSPICAKPMPVRKALRVSCPPTNVPNVQVTTFPATTAMVMTTMGSQCRTSMPGSISSPMATKKIALNMSRTGSIIFSTRWISRDSAMTAPIKNAPSATLYPSFTASNENPKHSPKTVTSSISLLLNRAT